MNGTQRVECPTRTVETLPLTGLISCLGRELHYPFSSLKCLYDYVKTHCVHLADPLPLLSSEYLHCNPHGTEIVLRALGYLPQAPWLRIVLLHLVLFTGGAVDEYLGEQTDELDSPNPLKCSMRRWSIAMEIMDWLRRDTDRHVELLEYRLREELQTSISAAMLAATESHESSLSRSPSPGESIRKMNLLRFTADLRHGTQQKVSQLKLVGERPALLIVPSMIAVANYGLYVRGKLEKGAFVAGYAGEREQGVSGDRGDAGCGYRMELFGGTVMDSRQERCLCAMMNDARHSVYRANCRFTKSASRGVRAKATRCVVDEELFTSYGNAFKLNLGAAAASFTKALLPDFALLEAHPTLPSLRVQERTL